MQKNPDKDFRLKMVQFLKVVQPSGTDADGSIVSDETVFVVEHVETPAEVSVVYCF